MLDGQLICRRQRLQAIADIAEHQLRQRVVQQIHLQPRGLIQIRARSVGGIVVLLELHDAVLHVHRHQARVVRIRLQPALDGLHRGVAAGRCALVGRLRAAGGLGGRLHLPRNILGRRLGHLHTGQGGQPALPRHPGGFPYQLAGNLRGGGGFEILLEVLASLQHIAVFMVAVAVFRRPRIPDFFRLAGGVAVGDPRIRRLAAEVIPVGHHVHRGIAVGNHRAFDHPDKSADVVGGLGVVDYVVDNLAFAPGLADRRVLRAAEQAALSPPAAGFQRGVRVAVGGRGA